MNGRTRISCFLVVSIPFISTVSSQPKETMNLIPDPKIVFLSNRDAPSGHFDIFIMNMDGTGQINLTKASMTVRTTSRPQLSPDQKKILFLSYEANQRLLTIMDQDGKNKIHVAEVSSDNPQAQFSPDGSKVLFVAARDGIRQIYTVESNGRNETNLSRNRHHEYEPAFSPDGSRIAFVSDQDGTSSIMIMDSDGKNRQQLTDPSGEDRDPNFSPDGSQIVFSSARKRNSDIYLMESDGTNLRNLTNSASMENEPRFHPNSSKILFVSNRSGMTRRDICSIDVQGQSYKNLTDKLNFANLFFDVSPDGKHIAFTSIKSDGSDVYIMDSEGDNPRNLSRHKSWDQNPSF